jgi:hypothetical protein
MESIPLIPRNVRECREERACVLTDESNNRIPLSMYDPEGATEEELLVAKQLVEDAFARNIIIDLADLGIASVSEVRIPAQASSGPVPGHGSRPLPTGALSQVVLQ